MDKLIKISELSKLLKLINQAKNKPSNYILRYWEKEFKQLKPQIINNHRYYNQKQVEIAKLIKFLLKNKGMTISGVKKVLDSNVNKLDDYDALSLKTDYSKSKIKDKSLNILKKLKKLKNYGKKNSY